MDFSLKSIRGLASEAATTITRVVQLTEETLGMSERTDLSPYLESLCKRADAIKAWTEAIVYKTESLLQPNPGARVEDYIYEKLDKRRDRMRLNEELGYDMVEGGKEFGADTLYGGNLIKVGQAQLRLGQSEKEFVRSAYRGFIVPLRKFLDENVKTRERKVLEAKRLDYDYAKKRLSKARETNTHSNSRPELIAQEISQAEVDVKKAYEEYEQQADLTRVLLEGMANSHVNHVSYLQIFVEAQIAFYAECHKHMCDLQYDLATGAASDNINKSSTQFVTAGMQEISLATPVEEQPPFAIGSSKKRARVLFDYEAQNPKEISLRINQVVLISHPRDLEPDWRMVENGTERGLVPLAYLEIFD